MHRKLVKRADKFGGLTKKLDPIFKKTNEFTRTTIPIVYLLVLSKPETNENTKSFNAFLTRYKTVD